MQFPDPSYICVWCKTEIKNPVFRFSPELRRFTYCSPCNKKLKEQDFVFAPVGEGVSRLIPEDKDWNR